MLHVSSVMLVSRRVYLHSNGTSYTPFPALLQIIGEMRVSLVRSAIFQTRPIRCPRLRRGEIKEPVIWHLRRQGFPKKRKQKVNTSNLPQSEQTDERTHEQSKVRRRLNQVWSYQVCGGESKWGGERGSSARRQGSTKAANLCRGKCSN